MRIILCSKTYIIILKSRSSNNSGCGYVDKPVNYTKTQPIHMWTDCG